MKSNREELFLGLKDEKADGGWNKLYWRKNWISFKTAQQQKNKDKGVGTKNWAKAQD